MFRSKARAYKDAVGKRVVVYSQEEALFGILARVTRTDLVIRATTVQEEPLGITNVIPWKEIYRVDVLDDGIPHPWDDDIEPPEWVSDVLMAEARKEADIVSRARDPYLGYYSRRERDPEEGDPTDEARTGADDS